MLFEVENLDHASPATVSRCGMIYMNTQILNFGIIIKSWFNKFICKYLYISIEDLESS
jgi:dynein heavy chain